MADTPNKSNIYVPIPIPAPKPQYSSTELLDKFKDDTNQYDKVPAPKQESQYSSAHVPFKDNIYGPTGLSFKESAPQAGQAQKATEILEFKPRNNFFMDLFAKEKNSAIDDHNTKLLDGKYNKAYEALKNSITAKGIKEDSPEFKKSMGSLVNEIIKTNGKGGIEALDDAVRGGNLTAANTLLAKTKHSITQEQMPKQQNTQSDKLTLTQSTNHYTLAPAKKVDSYSKLPPPPSGSTTFQDRLSTQRAQGQQTIQRP